MFEVDLRARCEDMNPPSSSGFERLGGPFNIGLCGPRKPADDESLHLGGDPPNGLVVAGTGDREPRLDNIDAEAGELLRYCNLRLSVESYARRLFSIPEGGIENSDMAHEGPSSEDRRPFNRR